MKPDLQRFLEVAAGHLMMTTAPALGSRYAQSNVGILGAMLMAVAEEHERAAARRVEENRALRHLFRQAVPVVNDGDLRGRLERAAATEDAALAVSALEHSNAELRALLIELHAHAEEIDSPEARRLEENIWAELVASTERRKLSLGAF